MSKKKYVVRIESDSDLINHPREDWDQLGTLFTWHRHYRLGGKQDFNRQTPPGDMREWLFNNIYLKHTGKARLDPRFEPFEYDRGYLTWYICGPSKFEFDRLTHFLEQGTLDGELLTRFEELSEWVQDEQASPEEQDAFFKAFDKWVDDNVCIKDVYLYDHSGVSVSCSAFSCSWDSGQVGFIYITRWDCEKAGISFDQADKVLEGEVETLNQYLTGDVWYFNSGFSTFEGGVEDAPFYSDDNVEVYLFDYGQQVPGELEDYLFGECEDSCGGFYGHGHLIDHIRGEVIPWVAKKEAEKLDLAKEKLRRTYWCM